MNDTICQNQSTLDQFVEDVLESGGRHMVAFKVDTMPGVCHGGIRYWPWPDSNLIRYWPWSDEIRLASCSKEGRGPLRGPEGLTSFEKQNQIF